MSESLIIKCTHTKKKFVEENANEKKKERAILDFVMFFLAKAIYTRRNKAC